MWSGYFVDSKKQIVGPSGPTGFYLDEDEYILKNGRKIDVYIEDGRFYKAHRWLLLFTAYSPTGHSLDVSGKIMGDPDSLPWRTE